MKFKFRNKLSPKALRQEKVEAIKSELKSAKSLVLFSSVNVTHKAFEDFRKKLEKINAKLRFVKNTLYRVAAVELKLPETLFSEEVLLGPTAAIYILNDDFISPIKLLNEEFGKEQKVKVKIALLDKDIYESAKVLEFAKIPSVDELRAKLVGTLNNPIQKLYYGLSDSIGKLVRSLNQIAAKEVK